MKRIGHAQTGLVLRANQRGFTLLEVLLAGFILFLVLTTVTLVYRGALLTSLKAERSLLATSAVPSIRILITESFRQGAHKVDHSGEGQYGDLDYTWTAKLTHRGKPSVAIQQEVKRELNYFLWEVDLTVKRGDMVRNYSFREISW